MLEDYVCGLYDFLKCVYQYTRVVVKVDAYPDDGYYFVHDGTKEKARYIARLMLNKYHHGLIVVGISTTTTKLHSAVLVVTCR